jgi:uncharacterized protein YidB (DUF937 family)
MSVYGIGEGQAPSTQQVQQMQHHGHGHSGVRKAGMDAAATALGLSSTDMRTALKNGETLTSLAQAKGVSLDSLTSAISAALAKANPNLSADRTAQIAQRIISGPSSTQGASSRLG